MPDIHDAAMQWAQANQQDPRAKDIMAKAWASQNPDDPRSAQVMAKLAGSQAVTGQTPNPHDTANNIENGQKNLSATAQYYQDEKQKPGMTQFKDFVGFGEGPPVVQGEAPMAIPAGSAGSIINGISKLLGSNLLTRMGANAAVGAANSAVHGGSATTGGVLGTLLGAISEAVQPMEAGMGRLARFTPPQADAYQTNPSEIKGMAKQIDDPMQTPELQDRAAAAIQNSRQNLRSEGLGNAKDLKLALTGKQVSISPKDLMGIDPEVDQMIQSKVPTHQDMPLTMSVDANEANFMKRKLQAVGYTPGGTNGPVTDPIQAAKNSQAAGAAGTLRKGIEDVGGQKVSDLNSQMQEDALTSKALRKGLKRPLAFTSSEAPDTVSTLARAQSAAPEVTGPTRDPDTLQPVQSQEDLLKFGSKYGAAKSVSTKDTDDALSRMLQKSFGRAGLTSLKYATPASLQQLLGKTTETVNNQ